MKLLRIAQAALLTGGFELGDEIATAVDLHGADGKGHAGSKVSRNRAAVARECARESRPSAKPHRGR